MPPKLVFYKDEEFTDKFGDRLDFGVVMDGSSGEMEIFARNEGDGTLLDGKIQISSANMKGLTVSMIPTVISPKQVVPVTIKWSVEKGAKFGKRAGSLTVEGRYID